MEQNIELQFEEMKAQMAILRTKLDKESIVNDKLLRETMKNKADSINRPAWVSVFASVFVILMMVGYFPAQGYSWTFVIVTIVFMLTCIFFTWKYHMPINSHLFAGDILTVSETFAKLKKQYQNWVRYVMFPLVLWIGFFAFESVRINGMDVLVGLFIGGMIGGFFGLKNHKKVVATCDEIIAQVELYRRGE